MDKDARNIDSWKRVCLADEPIYCAAPSPSSSKDIICLGSDEEIDEATTAARQLRYEDQGRHYLQGRLPHILSASLRGPFDKASGWQNPWLPKLPTQHQQCSITSSRPTVTSAVVRYEGDIQAAMRMSKEHDTNLYQDDSMNDSMDCHLPSPQSYEDLQVFDSPSGGDRHAQIESWAEHVYGVILEKDDFWAPDRDHEDYDGELAKKRPASRDWLKRRPAKRKRLNLSQNIAATSSPTPIPTTQLQYRSRNGPVTTKRAANRSFEMTTPSSSTDGVPRVSPGTLKCLSVVPTDEYDEQTIIFPTMSTEDIRIPLEQLSEFRSEKEDVDATHNMSNQQQQREMRHNREESDNISGYESCADDSFYYRARPPKQATPPVKSNATAADRSSQLIQTEIPASSRHNDTVIILSNASTISTTISDLSTANNNEHAEGSSVPAIPVATNNSADELVSAALHPDRNRQTWEEIVLRKYDSTDTGADRNDTSGVGTGRPLRDITSSSYMSRLNICTGPQMLVEDKSTHHVSQEPFLDQGSTLVCDPMEMEQPGNHRPTQQGHGDYLFADSSLRRGHSLPCIGMAGKTTHCDSLTTPDKADEAASCEPISKSSQGETTKSVTGVNAVENRDDDAPQIMVGNQTVQFEQQSPWMPICAANGNVETGDGNTEHAEDEVTGSPAPPTVPLLDSPLLLHKSPTIRPSQQSPWAQEVIERATTTRQEEDLTVNMGVLLETEPPKECQSPLLLTSQERSVWSELGPPALPASTRPSEIPSDYQNHEPNVTREDEDGSLIQPIVNTPVPQIARQSTPEPEVSIKSFSNFNFFSPQQSGCTPARSINRGILSSRKYPSMATNAKLSKRVSFAPFPHEQDGDSNQLSSQHLMRAASPPPPTIVDLDEEVLDGKYRNHFDVMNRRISVHKSPKLRYQQQLLPSSSQQIPESPSVEAMAEAFREADAYQSGFTKDYIAGSTANQDGVRVEDTEHKPQSPWRDESQGVDDVAAVIGNLDQFLDVWDVDMELDRNRAELEEASKRDGGQSNTDMSILQRVGIW
jgi:hypothetical protein